MVQKQKPNIDIPDNEKRIAFMAFRSSFDSIIDKFTDNLYSGRITLGMWEEDMRTRIREFLYGSGAIGKGGFNNLTRADKGWIGAEIGKQYRWLHRFAQDILDKRETVTADAIKYRAHLYAEAGAKVATRMQAGEDIASQLPWLPGDGSTKCLNNCGCEWLLTVVGVSGDIKTVDAVWTLHPDKEHCVDCIPRDGHREVISVGSDVIVPTSIGLGG